LTVKAQLHRVSSNEEINDKIGRGSSQVFVGVTESLFSKKAEKKFRQNKLKLSNKSINFFDISGRNRGWMKSVLVG